MIKQSQQIQMPNRFFIRTGDFSIPARHSGKNLKTRKWSNLCPELDISLRYAIKDYLRFYSEERPQDRYGCKTPSEVRQEALSSDVPTEYPIPENK